MAKYYEQFPIEDCPWIDHHAIDDIIDYKEYLRGIGASIAHQLRAPDSRGVDAFLTGAQQALKRFNITTRAYKTTSKTTFRFAEQKEKVTTVFLKSDATRINAQKDVISLLQWCMLQELKRHPNKHVPVTLLADEATNFRINDLSNLLTTAREYSIAIHIILQSFAAFILAYDKETLATLLNVSEIKQILPGIAEPAMLDYVEKLLGQESVIAESNSGSGVFDGIEGVSYSETGKPLLTRDEIRRCKKSILVIRSNKPMLVDVPPIAAISPFRKQIDINPFFGKPFLKRVKLRLEGRDGPWLWRSITPSVKRLWNRAFSNTGKES